MAREERQKNAIEDSIFNLHLKYEREKDMLDESEINEIFATLEALEMYQKLLQIPQRTIETLEVGDCLDITINDENVTCYLKIDNIETAKEYLNSLKSYEIHQIIPREFLELWGEISG